MNASTTPRIAIVSPDTFLAAVPHLLGFEPQDSVVIAGIGRGAGGRDEITLVQRFDTPSSDIESGQLQEISRSAAAPMIRTGAHEVIITVVADKSCLSAEDLPHRELVDHLVESFDDAGLMTRDSLYTDGTSRWSYGCLDSACCPPGGRVIPEEVRTQVAAEFVVAGVAVAGSRSDLVAELAHDPEHTVAVVEHLSSARDEGLELEKWRDLRIDEIRASLTTGAPLSDDSCALIISGLEDIRVRDTLLWDLAQVNVDQTPVVAVLTQVVRTAPEGHVAPSATVLSIQHWTAGDGARANVALERAMSDDPEYSLGGLVEASLRSGLPPATWRDLMRSMPRSTCRYGNSVPAPSLDPVQYSSSVGMVHSLAE